MALFQPAVDYVFTNEGPDFVDAEHDRGGPCKLGITMATLANFLGRPVTVQDIKDLTPATASPIYQRNYWRVVSGDAIEHQLVATAVLDAAVLTGPQRAARMVQRLVGTVQDGMLGPKTLAALNRVEPKAFTQSFADALEDWFIDIVQADSKNTQKTWLDIWFYRSRKMRKMALK